MFLSVIVPVYNAGVFFKECLESLAAQTFSDMEVILVDDGSTDGSGEICDEYAAKDSRFHVLHKKNGGPASAKREGLKIARGEYIGFADSDDRMEADYYETLVRHAKDSGAEIVTCGVTIGERNVTVTDRIPAGTYQGGRLEKLRSCILYDTEYETEAVTPSAYTKIYKKECLFPFLSAVPDGIYTWEDLCYVYPAFFIASCVEVTHDCGYHYRIHENSVTHRQDAEQWEKTLRSVSVAREFYARFSKEIRLAFYVRCSYIFADYLRGICGFGEQASAGIGETVERLRKETSYRLFREITKAALEKGQIKNKGNRFFLSCVIRGRYTLAVLYCKGRIGISRGYRFLKKKKHG